MRRWGWGRGTECITYMHEIIKELTQRKRETERLRDRQKDRDRDREAD